MPEPDVLFQTMAFGYYVTVSYPLIVSVIFIQCLCQQRFHTFGKVSWP